MDDKAKTAAVAQLAAGANSSQAQQIISTVNKFDNADDNDNDWTGSWKDGDLFDDDWQSFAALAASGKITAANLTSAATSFLSAANNTLAQALYTNVSSALQQLLTTAKAYVLVMSACRHATSMSNLVPQQRRKHQGDGVG